MFSLCDGPFNAALSDKENHEPLRRVEKSQAEVITEACEEVIKVAKEVEQKYEKEFEHDILQLDESHVEDRGEKIMTLVEQVMSLLESYRPNHKQYKPKKSFHITPKVSEAVF